MFTKGKASSVIYITGKVSWVKALTPNQWNKWDLTVHPTAESLEKIRDLQAEGIKNVVKKDDDGYFVRFSRPTMKEFAGRRMHFAPPEVRDKDGRPMEGVAIGNGSDATIGLEIFEFVPPGSTSKTKAARWYNLRIDNLIPFNPDTDFPDGSPNKEMAEGMMDQKEQLF